MCTAELVHLQVDLTLSMTDYMSAAQWRQFRSGCHLALEGYNDFLSFMVPLRNLVFQVCWISFIASLALIFARRPSQSQDVPGLRRFMSNPLDHDRSSNFSIMPLLVTGITCVISACSMVVIWCVESCQLIRAVSTLSNHVDGVNRQYSMVRFTCKRVTERQGCTPRRSWYIEAEPVPPANGEIAVRLPLPQGKAVLPSAPPLLPELQAEPQEEPQPGEPLPGYVQLVEAQALAGQGSLAAQSSSCS